MNNQLVDLMSPILSSRKGTKPLFLNVKIQPQDTWTESGPMVLPPKNEVYVCLSYLPDELRRRVETAIQSITTSI